MFLIALSRRPMPVRFESCPAFGQQNQSISQSHQPQPFSPSHFHQQLAQYEQQQRYQHEQQQQQQHQQQHHHHQQQQQQQQQQYQYIHWREQQQLYSQHHDQQSYSPTHARSSPSAESDSSTCTASQPTMPSRPKVPAPQIRFEQYEPVAKRRRTSAQT